MLKKNLLLHKKEMPKTLQSRRQFEIHHYETPGTDVCPCNAFCKL